MSNDRRLLSWDALTQFCRLLQKKGIHPCRVEPQVVAAHFRAVFRLPMPIEFRDVCVLLHRLACPDVYFLPGMEQELGMRGSWFGQQDALRIFVDASRPPESQIKTLFHEFAEIILDISYSLDSTAPLLEKSVKEHWANSFSAMLKMPPALFRASAAEVGLDLRKLAELYKDTIAGTSRQVRDLNAKGMAFYVCRFDLELNPKRNCPVLLPALEKSDGVCVKVVDVVRTPQVNIHRRQRGGALPHYNLPAFDHFRVMHPGMKEYIRSGKAVFIPSIHGAAAFEGGWGDLFGIHDLAVLIRPYGYEAVSGFFLMAVHPSMVHMIEPQLEEIGAETRRDMSWLFSWAAHTQKRGHRRQEQIVLPIVDLYGRSLTDRGCELQRWPLIRPLVEVDGDESWRRILFGA